MQLNSMGSTRWCVAGFWRWSTHSGHSSCMMMVIGDNAAVQITGASSVSDDLSDGPGTLTDKGSWVVFGPSGSHILKSKSSYPVHGAILVTKSDGVHWIAADQKCAAGNIQQFFTSSEHARRRRTRPPQRSPGA